MSDNESVSPQYPTIADVERALRERAVRLLIGAAILRRKGDVLPAGKRRLFHALAKDYRGSAHILFTSRLDPGLVERPALLASMKAHADRGAEDDARAVRLLLEIAEHIGTRAPKRGRPR